MITLITGGTGDGKTALAVQLMATEYHGRPIFTMGIPDLKLDHTPTPVVSEWTEMRPAPEDPSLELAYFTFPENSVIFLDEGQRVFRPRHPSAKVPPEVQAFETHRHCGIDWVIITQFPQLLDNNIRRLVKRHIHIHATPLGKYRLDWPTLGDPEDKASREIATKTRYSPPKEVFGLYKSAETHTKVKYRLPMYVYMFFGALLLALVLGYRGYDTIKAKFNDSPTLDNVKNLGQQTKQASPGAPGDKLTKAAYYAEQQPRIDGLAHTAPKYDELTKPTDAPFPVACVSVSAWQGRPSKCRCIDQQGNNYHTTAALCGQFVTNGMFKDWGNPRSSDDRPQAVRPTQDNPTSPLKAQVTQDPQSAV
jgi:zona occludens toxin